VAQAPLWREFLLRDKVENWNAYPLSIPAVKKLDALNFDLKAFKRSEAKPVKCGVAGVPELVTPARTGRPSTTLMTTLMMTTPGIALLSTAYE